MAYAAVISLMQTIERLVYSSHISILPPSIKTLKFAYKHVLSLEEVLRRLDSSSNKERLNELDEQIRDAVCKLEDVLETHVSNLYLSLSEEIHVEETTHILLSLSLDLEEVKQDIDCFTQTVKKIQEHSKDQAFFEEEEEDDADDEEEGDATVGEKIKKSNIVGLYDQIIYFLYLLLRGLSFEREIVSLVGMAGIGKSTLANEIFEDPLILSHFDCRVWVRVGPKYHLKFCLQCILAQVNHDSTNKMLLEGDGSITELKKMVSESLKGMRYLIVLDDVWNRQVWDDLQRLFPDEKNGSRVLLTTRLEEVADFANMYVVEHISFLDKEDSWCLLRKLVFGEKPCPHQLEKPGRKIAENCEGLPLTIVMIAKFLCEAEMTPEYWNNVAERKNSVFVDVYRKMTKVLLPSYTYLPQHLKACFLHMGVFRENYGVPRSKLIQLWSAEGFLETSPSRTVEFFALKCLNELVSKSLVLVRQKSSNDGIKICSLHSAFWHLCVRVGRKTKFSHVLNRYADSLAEGITSQRRLCVHNNVLFGIKDVNKSMASVSTARSLLCTSKPHPYGVPVCFGLRLLRVLDALTVRFYEFPKEVVKLIQLRYSSLTYGGKIPPYISKLRNLEYLIVHRHLNIIKVNEDSSFLPIEIWDMKELKHLQIMGSNLPDPIGDALLPNLLTLLDVGARSCTKSVLNGLPKLEKLGIRIELGIGASESLHGLDHIADLHELESLKCVIVDPKIRSKVVSLPTPLSPLPFRLRKLSLNGCGYPWEDMSKIPKLEFLKVLKLRCYAFRGPKWEARELGDIFPSLAFLIIEDTDLVHWTAGGNSFLELKSLIIRDCYKLEEIPWELGKSLQSIEVVDCNPLAMACAKRIIEDQGKNPFRFLDAYIHSSSDD